MSSETKRGCRHCDEVETHDLVCRAVSGRNRSLGIRVPVLDSERSAEPQAQLPPCLPPPTLEDLAIEAADYLEKEVAQGQIVHQAAHIASALRQSVAAASQAGQAQEFRQLIIDSQQTHGQCYWGLGFMFSPDTMKEDCVACAAKRRMKSIANGMDALASPPPVEGVAERCDYCGHPNRLNANGECQFNIGYREGLDFLACGHRCTFSGVEQPQDDELGSIRHRRLTKR